MRDRGAVPLPGMAPRVGDPGVFVCGPDDIAPWEREPSRGSARRVAPAGWPDASRPARRDGSVWLVLSTCPHCNPTTGRYCAEHNASNWWLTNWGRR